VDFTLEPPAADPDRIDAAAVRAALDRHGLVALPQPLGQTPLE
jgi:hypothetical protein